MRARLALSMLIVSLGVGCAHKVPPAEPRVAGPLIGATGIGDEKVAVVAIGERSGDGFGWWRPDGTPFDAPPPEAARLEEHFGIPLRTIGGRLVITRWESGKPSGSWAGMGVGKQSAQLSFVNGAIVGGSNIELPAKRKVATLDYSYPIAEVEKVASIMPTARTTYNESGGMSVEVVYDPKMSTEYVITEPAQVGDASVVAVYGPAIEILIARTSSGEEIAGKLLENENAIPRAVQVWQFPPIRTQDLTEFEVQRKLRAKLRFSDISLRPGVLTSPSVTSIAATRTAAPTPNL